MEVHYQQHVFEFEPLPGKPFEGQLVLNDGQRQVLAELITAEDDCWCLDDDGERLPDDQLFALTRWSCPGPAGPVKLLCRLLNLADGSVLFHTPELYPGDVSRWLRAAGGIPKEISRYYQEVAEEDRLASGPGRLEFVRTQEVVLRHLPPPPAIVLDVGGASGSYALWLAEAGYEVHLVDAAPRLVAEARRRSEASPHPISSCQVGDARDLAFQGCSADGVLLLGPLYHLTDAKERLRALREAHRVLRPGGVVFAAAISRYASALDGIARDLFADAAFAAIVQQDLERGQHRNDTDNWDYFTTAYFHLPDELQVEVAAAGFNCLAVLGLEGPGWLLADFDDRWSNPRKREDLLRVARALEKESPIIGLSAHLLAVGSKE